MRRARACRPAAVVLRADVTDLARPQAPLPGWPGRARAARCHRAVRRQPARSGRGAQLDQLGRGAYRTPGAGRRQAGPRLDQSARRAPSLYLATAATPGQARDAAWVLGEIGDKHSYRSLRAMLAHRDALARARAAAALGKIAAQEAAPDLRAALTTDIFPAVRAAAATALGRLGIPEAAAWLEPSRHDPHPAVRTAAQAATGRLRPH